MAARSTLTRIGHALFTLGLSLALAVLLFHFVFQPFQVSGLSMSPTLEDQDYLLVDRLFLGEPHLRRGEVMVLRMPQGGPFIVKRLVGLPGDSVEIRDGVIRVNGKVFPPPPRQPGRRQGLRSLQGTPGALLFLGGQRPREPGQQAARRHPLARPVRESGSTLSPPFSVGLYPRGSP